MHNRDATWKVTIDDGFTIYLYTFEKSRGDVSIAEIAELVKLFLGTDKVKCEFVKDEFVKDKN